MTMVNQQIQGYSSTKPI